MGAGATTLSSQFIEKRVTKDQVPKDILNIVSFDKICNKTDKTASIQEIILQFNKLSDVYLSHEWGGLDRDYHQIVKKINQSLLRKGLKTWFDESQLKKINASRQEEKRQLIAKGIDRTRLVLVFITKRYMEKINGNDESDTNKLEFRFATSKRSGKQILPIILEEEMKDSSTWEGVLGSTLGSTLSLDLTRLIDPSTNNFDNCVEELYGSIVTRIGKSLDEAAQSLNWKQLIANASASPVSPTSETVDSSMNGSDDNFDPPNRSVSSISAKPLSRASVSGITSPSSSNLSTNTSADASGKASAVTSGSVSAVTSANISSKANTSGLSVKSPNNTITNKNTAANQSSSSEDMIIWFVDHVSIPYTVAQMYTAQLAEEGIRTIAQLIKKLIMNSSYLNDFDIFDPDDITEIKVQMQLSDGNSSPQSKLTASGRTINPPSTISNADDVVQYFAVAKYADDQQSVIAINKCIAIMDKKRQVNESIGQQEGCKLLVKALNHALQNHRHKSVVEGMLRLLCILSRFDTDIKESSIMANVELLGWFGGCECIHKIMSEYGRDDSIALLCCIGIRNLAGNHQNNQINFGFNGTCEEIINLMNVHSKSSTLIQQAFGAVWNLCGYQENQTKLGSYGICDIMKKALRQHMGNPKVVEVAFGCIRNLINQNNDNKSRFGVTGMCEIVTIALSTHLNNANIVRQGCGVVWSLAGIRANKQKLFEANVCEAVCTSLTSYPFNPEVMEQCCGAIWSLATASDPVKDQFFGAGICEPLVKVLSTHMMELPVAETAVGAIMVLCANRDDIKAEFKAKGVLDLLNRAASLHFNHAYIADNARTAIKNMNNKTPKRVQSMLNM